MSGQTGFQAWDESYWPSQVGAPWTLASHSALALKEFPESGALVFLQQQLTGRLRGLRWGRGKESRNFVQRVACLSFHRRGLKNSLVLLGPQFPR